VDVAEQQPGTLIAMSTHGRSGLARWALGSVTDKVLHATSNPMLIVRSQDPENFSQDVNLTSLLVPLDGSALAERVLPLAAILAKALGLRVTLLRATPSIGDYYQYADSAPPAGVEDLAREVDEEAATYLDDTARRLRLEGVREAEQSLVHGSPEIAVTDYVREVPHCLVAMTTHGRSGIGRWVLGSVADRVIRSSGAPVLVMRSQE
jgi:nucleotide-binding universal stress UspA family protein